MIMRPAEQPGHLLQALQVDLVAHPGLEAAAAHKIHLVGEEQC